MKYAKPPLTLEQQADLLIQRGMTGDRDLMIERLGVVNYYRLSGYWFPFRNPDDTFKTGTQFNNVWVRYVFDRQFRLLVMDAIERFEVAIRTQVAFHHAHCHKDPFAYAENPASLPNLNPFQLERFLSQMADDLNSSKETFVEHFRNKYGADHKFMPIWMATEVMTFGCLMTLYRGSVADVRRAVAKPLGVHDTILDTWLLSLNTIRNICAHHGRLWNRQFGVRPKIPESTKNPQWHVPVLVGNERMFGVLTILKFCMDNIAPQSRWSVRLNELFKQFPTVPLGSMGFPANWQECPIWKGKSDGR